MDRRVAEVGVLLVMLIWAANYVVVKAAVGAVPPTGFNFLRLVIGAIALFGFLRLAGGPILLARRDMLAMAGLGAIGFSLYQVLWGTALTTTTAGDSALIIGASPAIIAVVAAALGVDRFTWNKTAGALVALGGVGLVVASGSGLSLGDIGAGDLLTLGAATCWALYVAVGTPIFTRVRPAASAAWGIASGALWLVPFGVADIAGHADAYLQPVPLLAVLFSGLLAVALSQVLVMRAVPALGPIRFANYQFMLPPMAVVLGAVALGEAIRPGEVVGGAVIVVGILLARRDARLLAALRPRRAAP
ncbi:MAG: DMT family transporter [Chloroflexi bacterium]|nr:DMT family transporter [Chloroflexota bacterium]